jgi:Zinc finger, C2H2 type
MVLHVCPKCLKEFNKMSNYKYHMNIVDCMNKIKRKNFFCDKCNNGYTTKSSMLRHRNTCSIIIPSKIYFWTKFPKSKIPEYKKTL